MNKEKKRSKIGRMIDQMRLDNEKEKAKEKEKEEDKENRFSFNIISQQINDTFLYKDQSVTKKQEFYRRFSKKIEKRDDKLLCHKITAEINEINLDKVNDKKNSILKEDETNNEKED